ncbi:hypothetical protein MASR2M50_02360 [Thauera sp.]
MALNTQPNLFEPGKRYFRAFSPGDDFYEALIETHRDLGDEQSEMVNARLILLLANHIGDISVLREAMKLAREGVVGRGLTSGLRPGIAPVGATMPGGVTALRTPLPAPRTRTRPRGSSAPPATASARCG